MKHTFFLKESQKRIGRKESLILFSCYFKEEEKKFVYSTGEKIKPFEWNFEENRPKLKGKLKNAYASTIQTQLGRYSKTFKEIKSLCKDINESFTSQLLKEEFKKEFKKVSTSKNLFFDAYDVSFP